MELLDRIKDPRIAGARKALAQSAARPPTAFALDGAKFVGQALDSPLRIERIFFLHPFEGEAEQALLRRARDSHVSCSLVSQGVFFKLLGLSYKTAARVMAVVARPAAAAAPGPEAAEACVLIGENIRDPRNIGVLLRNADAWSVALAVFAGESADPFSRAGVRSSTDARAAFPSLDSTTSNSPARSNSPRTIRRSTAESSTTRTVGMGNCEKDWPVRKRVVPDCAQFAVLDQRRDVLDQLAARQVLLIFAAGEDFDLVAHEIVARCHDRKTDIPSPSR